MSCYLLRMVAEWTKTTTSQQIFLIMNMLETKFNMLKNLSMTKAVSNLFFSLDDLGFGCYGARYNQAFQQETCWLQRHV